MTSWISRAVSADVAVSHIKSGMRVFYRIHVDEVTEGVPRGMSGRLQNDLWCPEPGALRARPYRTSEASAAPTGERSEPALTA